MNNIVNLTKKVDVVLAKRNVPANLKAQVGLAIDISGSMRSLYDNGTVQNTVKRLLAVACRFDDNQSLDAWTFSNFYSELPPATPADFDTYVNEKILQNSKVHKWGGTSYAPVLRAALEQYSGVSTDTPSVAGFFGKIGGLFGGKPAAPTPAITSTLKRVPAYLIQLTDGQNDDRADTIQVIGEAQKNNMYIQFVGIGGDNFSFIESMADKYPHVGFVGIRDLEAMSDETLYEELLNPEFCTWVRQYA